MVLYTMRTKRGLSFIHLNVQSANNKATELETFFSEIGNLCDVVMFTETWYTDASNIFQLPNKKAFYLNRESRRGGGVSLLVNESISCDLFSNFSCTNENIEVLCVETNDTLFVVCYRPPDGSLSAFFTFMDNLLSFVNENRKCVVIGGDMNIDMGSENAATHEFVNTFVQNGCINAIESATRVTAASETTLDLFLTSYPPSCISSCVLAHCISDHMPICMYVESANIAIRRNESDILYQDISEQTLRAFQAELSEVNWDNILQENNAEMAYTKFITMFVDVYSKHFVYKKRKHKNFRKPWLTKYLFKKIKKRDQLYGKFVKYRDPADLKVFKEYRNKLTKELRKAKDAYYFQMFSSCSQSDKL